MNRIDEIVKQKYPIVQFTVEEYKYELEKVAMEVINKFAEASDKGIIIFIGTVKCSDFFKQLRKEYKGD